MLKTTLDTSVTDDSLYGFDELVFEISIGSSAVLDNRRITARSKGLLMPVTLKIEGDGYFTDSSLVETDVKEIVLSDVYVTRYLSSGNYKLIVKNKTNLLDFYFSEYAAAGNKTLAWGNPLIGPSGVVGLTNVASKEGDLLKLSDFKGTSLYFNNDNTGVVLLEGTLEDIADSVTLAYIRGQKVSGDVAVIASKTNLTQVSIDSAMMASEGIRGSIVAIGSKTNLTRLNIISSPAVNGELYDMLDAMVTSGKTSGNIALRITGTGVTLNGVVQAVIKTAKFNSSYDRGWILE